MKSVNRKVILLQDLIHFLCVYYRVLGLNKYCSVLKNIHMNYFVCYAVLQILMLGLVVPFSMSFSTFLNFLFSESTKD